MTAAPPGRLGAIVLAGGRSARFGRDKLAEPLDGRTLLMHAIEAVLEIETGLDLVVVGAPGAAPSIPAGARLVHDPRAFDGPLAGVATGLAALAPSVDRVVVVGGDMPGLVPAVLRLLASSLADEPAVALVLLAGDDRSRPLPAAIRRAEGARAADTLLAAGERRLRALAEVLPTTVIPASAWRPLDPAGATLGDVDTPADLPRARARAEVLRTLAQAIIDLEPGRRIIVAIDGVDGAGKTTLADELAEAIGSRRPVVRASEDDFHRPAVERYARGRDSPEGFYRDSYDDDALRAALLDPFASGGDVVTGVFDHRTDRPRLRSAQAAAADAVLLIDGIFLHRPGLRDRWDRSIWLAVDIDVATPRGAARGEGDPDPAAPSNRRYVEGQRRYLAEVDPASRATWVVDNTDLARPRIVRGPAG